MANYQNNQQKERYNVINNWHLHVWSVRQTKNGLMLNASLSGAKKDDGSYAKSMYVTVFVGQRCRVDAPQNFNFEGADISVDGTFQVSEYVNRQNMVVPSYTVWGTHVGIRQRQNNGSNYGNRQGGYQNGNYQQNNGGYGQQGGYQQAPQGGFNQGYNQQPQGGYNNAPQGGYNNAPQGGYQQAPQQNYGNAPQQGGYNQGYNQQPQGGYNNAPQNGGFNQAPPQQGGDGMPSFEDFESFASQDGVPF